MSLGLITCLECNGSFGSLTSHVRIVHGLSRNEYALKHNLPFGFKLVPPELRESQRERAIKGDWIHRHLGDARQEFTSGSLAAGLRTRSQNRPISARSIASSKQVAKRVLLGYSKQRSARARSRNCIKCKAAMYRPVHYNANGRSSGAGLRNTLCDKCYADRTPELICMNCKQPFHRCGIKMRAASKFCSHACYSNAMKTGLVPCSSVKLAALRKAAEIWKRDHNVQVSCLMCQRLFTVQKNRSWRKYCNSECYHISRRGVRKHALPA